MFSKATRFEIMLEAVPDALVGMDQKGVIRFVNRQTELLFGYDRDNLIGLPVETLVPEPLWQIYASHKDEYFADPRTRSSGLDLELSGRHQNGKEFPVNVSLSHIDTGDVLLVITAVRDVAIQKRAIKHAELIEAVVQFSEDAIIGTSLEGFVTSWNPGAERMYGYLDQEIIGKPASVLAPEHRAGELFANLERVSGGEAVERFETMGARKDGTIFSVSLTLAPIFDEDGAIVGASAIHRDVTDQRRAFEVAQHMEAIVESSDDAIIAITLEGTITSWNPAAEKLFGYTREEIIGKSAEMVSPKDRLDEVQAILARNRTTQDIEHLHTIGVRKDGSVFPVSLTVSPIRARNGVTVGTSMISRDMSALHHAVRYSRSLIEAALDPMTTISPAGLITDVNEATVKITGVPRQEVIGTHFSHYFTDPNEAHKAYSLAFSHGSVTNFPLTLVDQDGTLTEVLYNASVYRDFNDNVLGVLAVARDAAKLREQQQLSEQLQTALNSRIIIEQAKGITAQRDSVTIEQAYERIRTHARRNNASLHAVAEAIVNVGLQV
jgi:PAS domain S-box-containing protein